MKPLFLLLFFFPLLMAACAEEKKPDAPSTAAVSPKDMPGAALFKSKACHTCHSLGSDKLVGPGLKGLFSKREESWVRNYLKDPIKASQTDPVAIKLKEEYKTQMPNLMLSQQDIDQLVAYMKAATE